MRVQLATATVLVMCALTGCAPQKVISPAVMQEAQTPLICKDRAQCEVYWQRAQAWIAMNSGYKIQTATDTLIQTYGPTTYGSAVTYQLIKEPRADGTARILITPRCHSVYGCDPTPAEIAVQFKRYVRAQ